MKKINTVINIDALISNLTIITTKKNNKKLIDIINNLI